MEKKKNNINYLKEYSIGRKVIYLPEEDTIFIDSNDIELIGDKEKFKSTHAKWFNF